MVRKDLSWGKTLKRYHGVNGGVGKPRKPGMVQTMLPSMKEDHTLLRPKSTLYHNRTWMLSEFPTSVSRPGKGLMEGGAIFPRTFFTDFKKYAPNMNSEWHIPYQENPLLPDRPTDLGVLHQEYYDDKKTDWHKTLIPERDPMGSTIQGGPFVKNVKEHDNKMYQVYSAKEREKTRILEDMISRTWNVDEEAESPTEFVDSSYSNEWEDLYEVKYDPTVSIPLARVRMIDRMLHHWMERRGLLTIEGKQTKRVLDDQTGKIDYENDNEPLMMGRYPDGTRYTLEDPLADEIPGAQKKKRPSLKKEILKNPHPDVFIGEKRRKKDTKGDQAPSLYMDTGVVMNRPNLLGEPEFSDLVAMKRVANFEERRSAIVRPWHGVWGLDFDPQKVPRYVGWSLFASARHAMEYHPEYLPFKEGQEFDLEFDDPKAEARLKREIDDDSKIFDKGDVGTLDFFRVLHLRTGSSTKIVAQGRVDTFSELIVAGNGRGIGSFGYGRGRTQEEAMENAYKDVYKNLQFIPLSADRNLWSSKLFGKDHRAYVEIKSTIGAKDNKGGVLQTIILELLGIQGATIKKWGSRNIYSQIRALFKALGGTGDISTWTQYMRRPFLPPRFFSGAAYVEPRNLRKVYDEFELVNSGFGYHQEARLIQLNMKRLGLMKKEKKDYMLNLQQQEISRKRLEMSR
eukprot:TRINITY_DN4296_c0_g1_i1.p1 TRINITY_DN4296_c0_g1~~TRINITY_DN4296_c0_g1_i1.p1  ORF type:complete len:681 (-),score=163.28 TRINITY_DN4296_c0_g1_i1:1045-3087(-)